ncbi:hypothetical protein D0Y96_015600 [Acidipila sp. 4G-K13]|uniref:Uncharacterized protein n=1 Tax=Paracidobacterium acidisoli TaxID=2303751 RepID=A0A372IM19_9BACT|nr:hypothetical protein [Paracidobacterium acidisoli]
MTANDAGAVPEAGARSWAIGFSSFILILLQSACTMVMAVSGIRVLIGLTALAAAAGLHRPARGFHADIFRIPMMTIAVAGSVINLYVLWRIRTLRKRPAAQWRVRPASPKQLRSEAFQIALAILTLVLVAAEGVTHHIIHHVP